MAQNLTPQAIWSFSALALIVAVAGVFAYLYLVMAKVEAKPIQETLYHTSVLNTDLNLPSDPAARRENVFVQTKELREDTRVSEEQVTYTQEELGKSDLGRLGQ